MTESAGTLEWVRVAAADEIAEDSAVHVEAAGHGLCLARSRGQLYALTDECSHGQVRLSEGDVEDGLVECYLHGSCFELTTGRPLTPPATRPVPTFPVRVDGADVYVSITPLPRAEVTP